MSRTNESPRPATLNSTRQMLDELDALMARMLALPVSDVDDELQVPAAALQPRSTTYEEEPPLYPPEEPESEPEPAATIPLYRTEPEPEPQPARTVRMPQPVNWHLEPPPALDDIAPRATERPPLPELDEYPAPPTSLRRLFMAPLWLINGIFDGFTWLLGPLGRWLRGSSGRGVIGFLGIFLLLLAAVWVAADWMGWTAWIGWNWLPFPLE